MKKILFLSMWLFTILTIVNAQTTRTVGGTGANYTTLKLAFDAINSGNIRGEILLQITGSTSETATASLNATGSGSASYTSVNIYPTESGFSISGNLNNPLIQLTGADNVVIDGRVDAMGSSADLTLINSNTGSFSSAIRYLNSAENNIIQYCFIKSSCLSTGIGMIQFASSSSGNGNDNNIIEYCNITNAGGNRPYNSIFSSGGSGRENSGNIIRYNNFYDILNPNSSSNGIMISYLSTDWTISNNSFYETTELNPTGANKYYPIYINTGTNVVSNNYFGGSAPNCGGSAMTIKSDKASYYCSIFINGGNGSTVDNNTIKNINFTSGEDNPWDGIFINSGNVNITGNTIGATTGNGSITLTTNIAVATTTISGGKVTGIILVDGGSGYTTAPAITFSASGSSSPATATATISGGVVTGFTITNDGGSGYTSAPSVVFEGQSNGYSTSHGIIQNSTGIVNITNNSIGSINILGSAYYSHGFESIYVRSVAGITNINNNLIGSSITSNSIHTSSTASFSLQKQDVYGIYSAGTGTITISGNTVANLTNAYTGTNSGSRARGIQTIAGVNLIQNNIVKNISSASGQNSTKSSASVVGISQTSNSVGQVVSGNTVYGLSNTNPTARIDIYGIYYSGPTSGNNEVSANFIHSLSISSTNIGSDMDGLVLYNGTTICSNNIINLGVGITTGYKINGIWDDGGPTNNNSIFFNSIYIGGSVSSGTTSSTGALWNALNNSTRNYKNNILFNARSGGSTGKHYAIVIAGAANLSIDYNDYYVSGTGGVLGKIGSLEKTTLAAWQLGTSQDVHSLSIDPVYTNPGSTTALDYYTAALLPGISGTGITTDYAGLNRGAIPKCGALELNNFTWQGGINTDFGTAGNWSNGAVPPDGADIYFAENPVRSCVLDQNRTVKNITNAQATDILVLNGKQLTITGNLNFTNSAQIDGTASSSTVVFAGSSAQNIPTGSFVSNSIDSLKINNAAGFNLNGDFTINRGIALIAGNFAIGPNTLTFNGIVTEMTGTVTGGSSTNMIIGGTGSSISMPNFLLNNLTINRASGVNLYGDLELVGTLTLTEGTLTLGANKLTISGNSPLRTNGTIDASNSGSTLVFNNASAIILSSGIFSAPVNHLTISGVGGITASSDFTVNGVLNLQSANPSATKGSIDMWDGSAFTNLNMGEDATTIGIGDVTGIIVRSSDFVANKPYTFGNQFTIITIAPGGTFPTQLMAKITIGTAPSWKSGAILRINDFIRTGGSGCYVTIASHYLDEELNGNNEERLARWKLTPPSTVAEVGRTDNNTTDNWLANGNISISNIPTSFGSERSLANSELVSLVWNGSVSDVWVTQENWTPRSSPSALSNIVIPDAESTPNDPTLTTGGVTINTLSIESGGILNSNNQSLTINGSNNAWSNSGGTFNAGSGTVTFTNSAATMSGTTDFFNVTINSGAGLTIGSYGTMRIGGAITNNGIWNVATMSLYNVVEYNGGNQTILNPNGSTSGYHYLIVSGSGTKTMPVTALNIHDDFTISGTATSTAGSEMTIGGELTIGEAASFATGAFNHIVSGNFDNNGSFTASAGYSITLNGDLAQLVYGTAATTFDNLTINNSNGVTLLSKVNVNNILTLTGGSLIVDADTLGINGTISKTSGCIGVGGISSLSFGGTDEIIFPDDLFCSSPSVNNLIINRIGGVLLGNQNMTVNGLLDLKSGTLNISNDTLIIAGISPTRTSGYIDASNSAANLIFTNVEPITLPASIFTGNVSNLTINGIGGVTVGSDFTITGILNLQSENPLATKGSLDMGINTLDMGANATTIGDGDVTGIIRRRSISPGVIYTYGSQFMTAYFPNEGILPTEMSAKISIGTAPAWRTGAINREIEIIQTGGSNTKGQFSYRYLDSELNGNNEDNLVFWVGLPTNYEYGRSAYNTADNWVSLSNVNVAFFSSGWDGTKNITLDEFSNTTTLSWNGSISDSWTSVENWTPNVGPSSLSNIIVPDASTTLYSPTLPAFTEIGTLTIEAAGILNSGSNSQLTINGTNAWMNLGGTFNPGTSTVIFTNVDATISGTTNFNNVTINTGASLRQTSGSVVRIAGSMNNLGTWHAVMPGEPTTVEYNGGNQTVVAPNPLTNRYSTLILSGNGTKTLPENNLSILDNFSMEGITNTTLTSSMTIDGNLSIANGCNLTLDPSSNLTVLGTLTNNAGASGLVLESNSGGTASLIHYTPNVQATVERYITGNSWHFMFSPLSELPTATYTVEGAGTNYNLYSYNQAIADFWSITTTFGENSWNAEYLNINLPESKGYIYNRFSLPEKIFSQTGGNLFVGDKEFAVSYNVHTSTIGNGVTQGWPTFDGWNLIGNPYASAIDWNKIDKTDIESGLYFYDGDNYQCYIYGGDDSPWDIGITINGGSQYIPSGQGFFVKVKNDSTTHTGTLVIPDSARVHNAQPFYKSSAAPVPNILKLRISNQNASDEAVIRTVPYATEGKDSKYDAFKMFSWNKTRPQIYSQNGSNNDNYAINALPEIQDNKDIPLGIYTGTAGEYSINMSDNSFDGYFIWLEDKLLGINQNISQNPIYNFSQEAENNTIRFVLHFGINHAPTAASIEGQSMYVNDNFEYDIPDNTFVDPDSSDVLSLSAKLSDGNKLPDWLSFDAASGRFYGSPDKVQNIEVGVTATDIFGKSAKSTFNIQVFEKSLSVETPKEISSITVYPNPSSGVFNIKTEGLSNSLLTISDMVGRVILKKEISAHIEPIDLSNSATGIYLIEIVSDKGRIRKKMEIQ